jgi:hypothetical protein
MMRIARQYQTGAARALSRILASAALLCGLASAEPYIAVRTGFKCSQCHVNRVGGGMRTDFGSVYSQYKLLMGSPLKDSLPLSFDPKLNGAVSIGSNFRVEQIRTREYSSGTVAAKSSDATTIREGNLYVNIELIKGFLSAYVDETVAPVAANREAFATLSLPGNAYFKFGNMLLPYGFRLMDDEAFVREVPNYNYSRTGLGYEVGFEPGPLSLIVNLGPENLSGVGSVILKGMPVLRTLRLGGSYGTPVRKRAREGNNTYGVFGGFAMGMFTVLAERDWTKKRSPTDTLSAISDYVELDVLPMRGLNFKFVYEYLWPDRDVPVANNGRRRITAGAEPFLTQFLQVGLYYRQNDWIPQTATGNQDEIVGRLHVFF